MKELKGQYKVADDVAPGDIKITGKATFGKIEIDIFNQLMFADEKTVGTQAAVYNEAHAVPAATPYTIDVTNSANFSKDMGVVYAATGQRFTRVASSPTQGEYTVSAGVYTFAAADTGAAIVISYYWTDATAGNTLSVNNQLMGYGPVWELYLYEPYQGNNGLYLAQCRSGKLSHSLKRDGYLVPEMDFQAFANPAGLIAQWFQTSV